MGGTRGGEGEGLGEEVREGLGKRRGGEWEGLGSLATLKK